MTKKSLLKRIQKALGPGFLSGAADNDPTAVATYSQSGAQFGYGQLWTAPFALPFMIAIQEMCGRIGIVTGQGLSGVIRRHYSKKILYGTVFLLLLANIVNIGADLGAMAASLTLIVPVPFFYLLLIITIGPLLLEIFIPYPAYAKLLKYLCLFLFSYLATALMVTHNWSPVFSALVLPHIEFSKAYMLTIVAILGTTICPYLFFWQSDQEVEEEVLNNRIRDVGQGTPIVRESHLRDLRFSTALGMFFSQFFSIIIMVTGFGALGAHGITNVASAADAAAALRPAAGDFAFLLFTLGIVGTGLLAVPVLAGSAAYAVSEALRWKSGLGKTFRQAPGFYFIIILATVVGLIVNVSPIDPIKMLYYAAALNGIISPILMALILLIGNNKKIMGNRTNSLISNIFGVTITAVMGGFALIVLWQTLGPQ